MCRMWQEMCKIEGNTDMKECVVIAFSFLLLNITFLEDVIKFWGIMTVDFDVLDQLIRISIHSYLRESWEYYMTSCELIMTFKKISVLVTRDNLYRIFDVFHRPVEPM
jgi:hypothetical protein